MSFLAIYLTASLVIITFINSLSSILNKSFMLVDLKNNTIPVGEQSSPVTGGTDKSSTKESGYSCALMLLLSLVLLSPTGLLTSVTTAGEFILVEQGPNEAYGLNKFSLLIEFLVVLITFVIVQVVKPSKLKESALLVSFSTLGLILMIETSNLIGLYLAVELYSLSAYILASGAEGVYSSSKESDAPNKPSISAGLKYFLLSALSSGILVVGISLIYGVTGELSLNGLSRALDALSTQSMMTIISDSDKVSIVLAIVGMGLILSTLLFKIGAAPFHFWVPDVYSKVSLFVNFYLISVPKIGILYTLIKISFVWPATYYTTSLLGFSILSLVVGAVGGLVQVKTTRLLAYSSISHVGYILLALYAAHIPQSYELGNVSSYSVSELSKLSVATAPSPFHIYSIGLYLLVYCFMTVNMFTVLYTLKFYRSKMLNKKNSVVSVRNDFISGFKGLSALNPFLAASMAVTLLSMAGVPPLAGFVAKLTVYMGVLDSGALAPAVFAVLCSVITAVYYLRLIKVAYFYNEDASITPLKALSTNSHNGVRDGFNLTTFSSNVISLCTLLIIFLPIIKPSLIFLYLN